MLGRGPSICSPQIVVVVEQQKASKASHSDVVMLMDVGHRLLCSLRQVDSRRRSSGNPPRTLLFTAHFNSHSLDMGFSSRCCRHGSQKAVSDDRLVNVLGEILRFGAALGSWRSWALGSERFTLRCMFHRSMAFASREARDELGTTKNDEGIESQTGEVQKGTLEMQKNGRRVSLVELGSQLENIELSNVHALQQVDSSMDKDSLSDASASSLELPTNVVVIVFDIETTGFKLSDDRIIEFAARDLAGGDCSTIQTLVNPERPVPLHASNVHGILSGMVNKSNIPRWKEVAPVLTQFVESRRILGGPVFLVAHNGKKFDVPFLMKEFERCSLQIPSWWQFVDSVPIAREVMKAKGEKSPLRLSALYEYYKLPYVGEAHRASADVDMLASVLQMLMFDLKMSFSEFLKKAFTTKDILRSSAPNSDNLESLPQDLDLSSELSIEAEDLSEVSGAPSKIGEDSNIPWDDLETNSSNDKDWQPLFEVGISKEEERKLCANEKISQGTNTGKSEMWTSRHDSSTTKSVSNMSSSHRLDYECNYSYRLLESDGIDVSQLSSILNEYLLMKSRRPDLLLLWRTGEFYQAFFEDAKKLSEVCDVALSAIQGGEFLDGLVPMASLCREHADIYIQALLAKGVGVFKQDLAGRRAHDASFQQLGSVILTPGTARVPRKSDGSLSSFLLAVVPPHTEDGTWGLAYTDISSGEICATEGQGQRSMIEEILTLHPSEILCSANANRETLHSPPCFGLLVEYSYSLRPSSEFCSTYCEKKFVDFFDFDTLENSGLGVLPVGACAVGGLLGFLEEFRCSLKVTLPFRKLAAYCPHDYMLLDHCTRSCLEVFKTRIQGQLKGSLFWALDHTKTQMGKRLLRQWMLRPLLDKESIDLRQNAVQVFVNYPELREQVRLDLSLMNDLERLAREIISEDLNPWNLLAMGQSIKVLQTLHSRMEGHLNPYFAALTSDTDLFKLGQKLQNHFELGASSILQGGHILKGDIDEALHELREQIHLLDEALHELREQIHLLDASLKDFEGLERDRTDITFLELLQNEKGDHFVRVKKHALESIPFPADYQLYSSETCEDAVCFVTTRLLEHNKKRSELDTKLRAKEISLLKSLRGEVCAFIKPLQITSQTVAAIDVLATFAELGVLRQYCKPTVHQDSREIKVKGGRHPVAELLRPKRELFNANSLYVGYQPEIDKKKRARNTDFIELNNSPPEEHWPCPDILIMTGPPASGKSCYLQQAGLLQLLAQIGSFVPAKEATLGIADAIFMKAEDSDNMSMGRSRFELDMDRCATILQNATSQSLVLLDGIDRGFSLNDDGAVMRALIEFLAQSVKARTLLTTQNTNLGSLEEEFANIASFQCINNVDSMFSFCVKPGFYLEPSVAALDRIDGLPKWISIRAAQLISKDDTAGEEACHLEQKLRGSDAPSEESRQLGMCLLDKDRRDEQAFKLEQEPLDTDASVGGCLSLSRCSYANASMQEGVSEVEQELVVSGSEDPLSGMDLEQQISSSNELASPPSSCVSEKVESPKNLPAQGLNNTEALKETWKFVLQVLEDYPATHALAKQKGILVSVHRSPEISEVHMTTSDLFLKKFLQQEHATALENAFWTVLKSPIELKLTITSERN